MKKSIEEFNKLLEDWYLARYRRITGCINPTKDLLTRLKQDEEKAKEKVFQYFIKENQPLEYTGEVYYYDLLREFGKPSGFKSGESFRKILMELLTKYEQILVHANGAEQYLETSFINEAFGGLIPFLGSKEEVLRRVKLYTLPVLNKKDNKVEILYHTTIQNSVYNFYK